ncbi:MAG: peptidase M23 [Proteobacteria bacterium]|nr:MAG: peptidase M23 [Pseudomonadota bacterium]
MLPSVTYFNESALCVAVNRSMNVHFHQAKKHLSSGLELHLWWQIVVPVFALAWGILLLSLWVNPVANDGKSYQYVQETEAQIDLALLQKKIALLEAESMRLSAFAQKMVELAHLDKDVFSFDQPPAQGGLNGRNSGFSKRGRSLRMMGDDLGRIKKSMLRHSNHLERMQLILKSRTFDGINIAQWPVSTGYISSPFGMRVDPFNGRYRSHRGIDIAGPSGTAVMSIAAGKVIYNQRKGGYGRVIELAHDNGMVSRYAHLSAILVKKGQMVARGELIGRLGSSGRSTGPHLHLEVLRNKKPVNPLLYLSKKVKTE